MKEYTYICRRGDDGRHTWVEYCPWTDGREGGHFVAVPPVPADVTHLTLVPAEGYLCNTAFGNNLFAPINSEKWRYKNWGPYNALEVITLADGFDIVGDWTLGGLGFYDRRLVPYRDDMAWEAPNLREVRLPATVYHIRQGVLDDLDAAVLVASESPYYYNTPDGALYDRRTNALVYIPTCREFLFSSKAMLAPAKNSLRTDYPLVDETPLSALRGAVRRGLRSVVIPKESKLANHWKIVDGVLYDRVLGGGLALSGPGAEKLESSGLVRLRDAQCFCGLPCAGVCDDDGPRREAVPRCFFRLSELAAAAAAAGRRTLPWAQIPGLGF